MGDRCDVYITMRQSDIAAMARFLPWPDEDWYNEREDNPDGSAELTVEEASYAWTDELAKAAIEGKLPFYGRHGSGGCYGDGMFASDGVTFTEADSSRDGYPVVEFNPETGQPDAYSMSRMRDLLKLRQEAVKLVHGKDTNESL